MNPIYFGSSEAPLFGVHIPPKSEVRDPFGVVLCYPGQEEYMRVHWAYRQLTAQLVKLGLHAFKFDYYGTGDSAGALGAGDADLWRANILDAVTELRDLTGLKRIVLVGVRLGAALAAEAGALLPAESVLRVIMWDPVVSGVAYINELRRHQQSRLAASRYPLERAIDSQQPELLGYPFSAKAEASIGKIDLLKATLSRCAHIVVASAARPEYTALAERLERDGLGGKIKIVDDPCRWGKEELLEVSILPQRLIAEIANAAKEGA